MRISIFANEIPSTVFIENLIKGLSERGHQLYIYGKLRKKIEDLKYSNITIAIEPETKLGKFAYACKYIFKLLFTRPALLFHVLNLSKEKSLSKWIYKFNMYVTLYHWDLDILNIQWAKSVSVLGALIKDGRINTVLSLRGTHINVSPLSHPQLKKDFEELFPYINGFHSVSNAMIEEAQQYDSTLPQRSRVAYPAVTDDTYEKFDSSWKKGNHYNILSIGRHHWIKGYTYALDAVKLLADEGIPVQYTVIAGGNMPDSLLFQMEDLDLYPYVKFVNGLPHDQVLKALKEADVLLLPSIEEGIPNVVLEAMAMGTPVVSTNCSGIHEIIDDGVSGYIVKACFPDSIASGLKKVYDMDATQREQMVNKAREKLNQNHRLHLQLDHIEKLYKQVVNHWQ